MQMNETEIATKPGKSKSGLIIIIVLILIFALPEIIAVGLHAIKWRPKTSLNHGELVQPARPIQDVSLQMLDGNTVKFSDFKNKWTMVSFGNAACLEACLKNIYIMRQVQLAQGKERERIQRVFVVTEGEVNDALKAKLKDYPEMSVLHGPPPNVAALIQQFVLPGAQAIDDQRVYLVDPLGNLMMSYRDDPRGMLKDLIYLLKNSWTG